LLVEFGTSLFRVVGRENSASWRDTRQIVLRLVNTWLHLIRSEAWRQGLGCRILDRSPRHITRGKVTCWKVTRRKVTRRHVAWRHVAWRHNTLGSITLGHITLGHITLGHNTLGHITLGHVALLQVTLRHVHRSWYDPRVASQAVDPIDVHRNLPWSQLSCTELIVRYAKLVSFVNQLTGRSGVAAVQRHLRLGCQSGRLIAKRIDRSCSSPRIGKCWR
jgi:hypothetical protein